MNNCTSTVEGISKVLFRTELLSDPENGFLGICPSELQVFFYAKIYTEILTKPLFIIVNNQEQPRRMICGLSMLYTIYYSAASRDALFNHGTM